MSAKLRVGGVEIEVSVEELGEALRQLTPWMGRALAPADPTPQVPLFQTEAPPPTTAARPAPASEAPLKTAPRLPSPSPAEFLQLIADAGAEGVTDTEKVAGVLGVKPKGIGSRTSYIGARLKVLGFATEDVYISERRPGNDGRLTWAAGPRIKEAIDALTERHP